MKAGYHVTEVKAANFSALDCGANPEAWSEIFVQLWDVDEGERIHMTAGKFAAIIRKVTEHVLLDDTAQLTFEVSDGVAPIQLHRAALPAIGTERYPGRAFASAGELQATRPLAGCRAGAGIVLWRPSRRADNGGCYKSPAFRASCKVFGLKHIRTRPPRPKTTDVIDKSFLLPSHSPLAHG